MRLVRSRLFIPLLIVSLAAITGAGIFSIQVIEGQQQDNLHYQAVLIDRYIDQADHMLGAVARVAGKSSLEEITTSMQAIYDEYGYFDTLYLLDNQSRIIRMVPPDARYLDLDMSGMPEGVVIGTSDGSRISRPFISLRTGMPTVYIAQDLPSGGFVIGELSLHALQHEISAPHGQSVDYVFLMDQYGTLIAHPIHDLVLQQTNLGDLPIFRQGESGSNTLFYLYEGTLVLGSAVQVERTGWVVVDQVPFLVAFGTYLFILGLTLIILIGLWLIVAWNMSVQLRSEIVMPLEHLSQWTFALSAGDFSLSAQSVPPPGTFAELDHLIDNFRQMSSAIQERQQALEQSREELVRRNEERNAAYEQLCASEEELQRNFSELKRTEEQLKESEQRFFDIISHLPDGTFVIDREGRVIAWNRAMEEITGIAAEDIIGKTDLDLSVLIYAERRPLLIDFIIRPDEDVFRYYPEARRIEDRLLSERYIPSLYGGRGGYFWIISSPLYDSGGRIVGGIETIRDVTDRKRAEDALNQARKKLNMLNAITFSDIQNSIYSLSGFLQLQKSLPGDDQLQKYTDMEIGLVQAVSDSLKYADIYQSLGMKSPVWQNVCHSFLMGISHLDFSYLNRRLDVGNVEIYAEPMLENVFFALAENVIQHAKTATEYSLSYMETSDGLCLIFEDNGPGIPHDLKEKIFEREYTRRKGISLFLSREILSITGITIRETGVPGSGSRFEIFVPNGIYRFAEGKESDSLPDSSQPVQDCYRDSGRDQPG